MDLVDRNYMVEEIDRKIDEIIAGNQSGTID